MRLLAVSNYLTFNDDATARVLVLLHQATKQVQPLQGELASCSSTRRA